MCCVSLLQTKSDVFSVSASPENRGKSTSCKGAPRERKIHPDTLKKCLESGGGLGLEERGIRGSSALYFCLLFIAGIFLCAEA